MKPKQIIFFDFDNTAYSTFPAKHTSYKFSYIIPDYKYVTDHITIINYGDLISFGIYNSLCL